MIKKISLNIIILFTTYFLPLYFQYPHKDDIDFIKSTQNYVHVILLLGSGILIFLNYIFIKRALSKKWIWITFEIIGIIGLIYSAGILWLLYEFRHGIGF